MLQSLDKQTQNEIYEHAKVPSIFKEEYVGWNLNKRMLVSL